MLLDFLYEFRYFFLMLITAIIIIIVIYILLSRPEEFRIEENETKPEEKTQKLNMEPQVEAQNQEINEELMDMPTIITHFSETHEEEEAEDDISSNLNEDSSGELKSVKAYIVDDDRIQEDDIIHSNRIVTKPRRIDDEEFAFLYQDEEEDHDSEKNPNKRYHVLYLKEENRWFVKREGKEAILKTFETQKEAIAFATIKALENETSVVVHRRDGKIRKYSL